MTAADPWAELARFTPARIALGRAGSGTPTREVLRFAGAHALARDAVHAPFDAEGLAAALAAAGLTTLQVESDAPERSLYLRRPDFGRRLSAASRTALQSAPRGADLVIVVGDGLSATAVARNAAPVAADLARQVRGLGLTLGPVVLARGARVALGDDIGAALGARAVAMLIGERPGLSAPDSLGIYLTLDPKAGRTDAERNCLSNIREGGLPADVAAFKAAWLLREALRRGATGVALKDESDLLLVSGGRVPLLGPVTGPA